MTRDDLQKLLLSMNRDYTVIKPIGSGSFGEVWLLRDNALNRYEVVKTLVKNVLQKEGGDRWQSEFEGVKSYAKKITSHPNLIIVHDAVNTEQCLFYFMEAADNRNPKPGDIYNPDTLLHRVTTFINSKTRMPRDAIYSLMLDLLNGVQTLHENGLQHRDIKLENIVFVNKIAKLTDVGGVAEIGERDRMVSSKFYLPVYRSKEEYDPVDHDLYALGKILYTCLTGLDPEDYPAIPDGFLQNDPRDKRMNIFLVHHACADEKQDRFKSVAEFREAFLAAWDPPRNRIRLPVIVSAAVALVAILASVFILHAGRTLYRPAAMGFAQQVCTYGDSVVEPKDDELVWHVENGQEFASCLFAYRDLSLPDEISITFQLASEIDHFNFEFSFYEASLGAIVNLSNTWQKRSMDNNWVSVSVQNGAALSTSRTNAGRPVSLAVLNPPLRLSSEGGWNKVRIVRQRSIKKKTALVRLFVNDRLLATELEPFQTESRFCMAFRNAAPGTLRLRNLAVTKR